MYTEYFYATHKYFWIFFPKIIGSRGFPRNPKTCFKFPYVERLRINKNWKLENQQKSSKILLNIFPRNHRFKRVSQKLQNVLQIPLRRAVENQQKLKVRESTKVFKNTFEYFSPKPSIQEGFPETPKRASNSFT